MKYAISTRKKIVKAYELGAGSEMERRLTEAGMIRRRQDGLYELFSLEAVNGAGELARAGDYFKVTVTDDGYCFPYPNERAWFVANHSHIEGDLYEKHNDPTGYWESGDPVSEEIDYLLSTGKMTINPDDEARYFNAFLFGAPLSAAKDAVVIFYRVDRDSDGCILDVNFNFIARDVFEETYTVCDPRN